MSAIIRGLRRPMFDGGRPRRERMQGGRMQPADPAPVTPAPTAKPPVRGDFQPGKKYQ